MLYGTVFIEPSAYTNSWTYRFNTIDGERGGVKDGNSNQPSSIGFYHYPRKMGKKNAFEKLKQHLIKKHVEEIARLYLSLEQLYQLEYI